MWKPAYNLTRAKQPPLSATAKRRMRKRWRDYANRNALAGLTTRGTIPKRRIEQRLLLADVNALAVELAAGWDELPPKIQAAMLRLEIKLSAVRKQIL